MNLLESELERLYHYGDGGHPHIEGEGICLLTQDGCTRCLVLELARPADWSAISEVWRRVQTELGLPAPAIVVSGADGFQLWFSLQKAVLLSQARQFLEALIQKYLGNIDPKRISLMPSEAHHVRAVPALQETGVWSAYVAPDLASIFTGSPWLDVCPSPEAQGKVLSGLESITPEAFQSELDRIARNSEFPLDSPAPLDLIPQAPTESYALEAKRFLLSVMNDKSVEMSLRIKAAKALLSKT
jgi:hypothetical protein